MEAVVQGKKQESAIIEYFHFQRNQRIRVEHHLNNKINQLCKRRLLWVKRHSLKRAVGKRQICYNTHSEFPEFSYRHVQSRRKHVSIYLQWHFS